MDEVVLIVPENKKYLVFEHPEIFGDILHGIRFPISNNKGDWVYKLPSYVAAHLFDEIDKLDRNNTTRIIINA